MIANINNLISKTEEQLLEVRGDNNEEEEDEDELDTTAVEGCVTLDRADNNVNADNAWTMAEHHLLLQRLWQCDTERQILEELDAQKNGHLVEVGPDEAKSCSPWKRQNSNVLKVLFD